MPPAFRRYTRLVVFATACLIWVGAAVTTKNAGMIFADWPLSQGSINPPQWLQSDPHFWEHFHRLIASTVSFLVLGLFLWARWGGKRFWLETLLVVVGLGLTLGLAIVGGAERVSAERKMTCLLGALVPAAFVVAWLVWTFRRADQPLTAKLASLALVLVIAQAILGGLRVTEISNWFGALHGSLGQVFFCSLILLLLASSPHWTTPLAEPWQAAGGRHWRLAVVFCGAVFLQLLLGALVRHHHREGLPDEGILLTKGGFFPPWGEPVLVLLFLHKWWAWVVFGLGLGLAVAVRQRGLPALLAVLLCCQVTLGIGVLLTGKSFWVTNVHVINGLAILATAFVLAVRGWRARRDFLLASQGEGRGRGGEALPGPAS